MSSRIVAVVDIGKANAKVALLDLEHETEIGIRRAPNAVRADGRYPHYDIERLWDFILTSLGELQRETPIDAIAVTTHGAAAALLDATGELVLPVLDYEFTGPDDTREAYERVRPPFAETGSPPLPAGLNLGAQLFWQRQRFPNALAKVSAIIPYPQYWSFRLSGVLASEVTSLGCHTDLWAPRRKDYSSLVQALAWRRLFPPLRPANDALGPLQPELAARTGISARAQVYCGIHDSNASLLPHLLRRKPPFSVVSTGTWVICLSVGGKAVALDPGRDTLINVSAGGEPVPSARFMGGRENQMLAEGLPDPSPAETQAVLARRLMYLPAAVPASGPFTGRTGLWTAEAATPGEKRAVVSLYLALMAATCLELCGAGGPVVVEGPFAANRKFLSMLRAATGRDVVIESVGTGTSLGAALLTTNTAPRAAETHVPDPGPAWAGYAAAWRALVQSD